MGYEDYEIPERYEAVLRTMLGIGPLEELPDAVRREFYESKRLVDRANLSLVDWNLVDIVRRAECLAPPEPEGIDWSKVQRGTPVIVGHRKGFLREARVLRKKLKLFVEFDEGSGDYYEPGEVRLEEVLV